MPLSIHPFFINKVKKEEEKDRKGKKKVKKK